MTAEFAVGDLVYHHRNPKEVGLIVAESGIDSFLWTFNTLDGTKGYRVQWFYKDSFASWHHPKALRATP